MLGQWIDLPLDAVPWLYAADGPPTMASEQSFFLDVYAWYPYLHVFPPFLFPLSMHSLSHLYPRVCAFLSLSVKLFLPDQIESRKSLFCDCFFTHHWLTVPVKLYSFHNKCEHQFDVRQLAGRWFTPWSCFNCLPVQHNVSCHHHFLSNDKGFEWPEKYVVTF